ncbi:HIT-like protein [Neoconidiobolus thromboides FSU 785]|nr:HIT-like protein [Neoconidiobolus thromboides FSU 785]
MSSKIVKKIMDSSCIFCKIIEGKIPSHKIIESEKSYAFLDIGPLSKGHALVIPKYHAEFMHQLPDDYLADLLPLAKKVALASNFEFYNILQNNGKIAHQVVPHVHFHLIPKPDMEQGLGIQWPAQQPDQEELKKYLDSIKQNL